MSKKYLILCMLIFVVSACGDKDETTNYSDHFDYTLRGIGGATIIAMGRLKDLEFNRKVLGDSILPVYFVGTATNQFIFEIFAQDVGSYPIDIDGVQRSAKLTLKSPSLSEPLHFTQGVLHVQKIKTGVFPDGEIQGYFEAKTELFPRDTVYVDGSFSRLLD